MACDFSAARAEDLTLATNVIAMRSDDDARTFTYSATLCEASKHRGCGECCNENDVVTLGLVYKLIRSIHVNVQNGLGQFSAGMWFERLLVTTATARR